MRAQKINFGNSTAFSHHRHVERYRWPLHLHQYAELVLMHSGELYITVDGEEERAVGGDFIFVPPFRPHSYHSVAVSDFTIYTFSPSLISDFLDKSKGLVGKRAVFRASDASRALVESRFLSEGNYSEWSVKSCLASMLSDYVWQVEMVPDEGDKRHVLVKLIGYLTDNLQSNPSLVEAAKSIGYSANYLSHVVKRSLGFGYLGLLGVLRTEEAKAMLTGTKKTSLDISIECGFGSERTFHRQFKKITGMSPSEYRRNTAVTVIDNDLLYPETVRHPRK